MFILINIAIKVFKNLKQSQKTRETFYSSFGPYFRFVRRIFCFLRHICRQKLLKQKLNQHITFHLFNEQQVNNLAPKQFRFGQLQFLKESDVHDYPQQPEFCLQPIIGPRLWSQRSSLYCLYIVHCTLQLASQTLAGAKIKR